MIRPGDIWLDDKGEHINAHGGGILYYDNVYYWFGEHKSEKSNSALVGVNCYSSADLCNWKKEGVALAVSGDTLSDIVGGCVIERPKVIYNGKTKQFVMWFHLELKGKGYSAARTGIATSENVTGPYRFVRSFRPNPGIYPFDMPDSIRNIRYSREEYRQKSWTPEWLSAMFNGLILKRDLEGGQMSRDMTLFVDDDGKAYHIYSSEENYTLHVAELNEDYSGYSGKYTRVAPAGWNEAPAVFKRNGMYWMITSGCTGWRPNEARMFCSPSIWGPWLQFPNPFVGDKAILTFNGQSTYVLKVQNVSDKYIFMGDIWRPANPIDGRYFWLPIKFDNNGVPVIKWMDEWNPAD
jgi:hypothetical protein